MTLEAIDINESGRITFYYNDGDMFGGHTIEISETSMAA